MFTLCVEHIKVSETLNIIKHETDRLKEHESILYNKQGQDFPK